jgi:hypothetical protein
MLVLLLVLHGPLLLYKHWVCLASRSVVGEGTLAQRWKVILVEGERGVTMPVLLPALHDPLLLCQHWVCLASHSLVREGTQIGGHSLLTTPTLIRAQIVL